MTDKRGYPDYELEGMLEVGGPERLRAAGDPVRSRILGLLSERAATTSQLADALEASRGNVGHHLKVLEEAGLVRVVRTRQVRAITEKYYGRTARLFYFAESEETSPESDPLRQAMSEYAAPDTLEEWQASVSTLRRARIPTSRAREFGEKVMELADEFDRLERAPGERVYGFVAGVYLTDLPELPAEEEED